MVGHTKRDAMKAALVPDLNTYSHQHQILAVADETNGEEPVPVMLYHWNPPAVCAIDIVKLAPRLLSMIKGFTSLGTFLLQDDLNVPESLSGLLAAQPASSPAAPTAQLLAALAAQLGVPADRPTAMQFFAFPVLGDDPDRVLGTGRYPVWKWVKPESVYRSKTGFWEARLHKALDNGEWNAGKNLTLLMGGVSEQGLRTVERAIVGYRSLESLAGEEADAGSI